MIDKFLGNWRISHYVYEAEGIFVGILREQRRLEPTSENKIRVVTQYNADSSLNDHPASALEGEWMYEIDLNDDEPQQSIQRSYPIKGEKITGKRLDWGWNTITEHGSWGEFAFTTFGALINPQRQIVCTLFSSEKDTLSFLPRKHTQAYMIGIAVPADEEWAVFDGAEKAEEVAELWRGAWQSFNVNGELEGIKWVERRYVEDGWEEFAEGGGVEAIKISEQFWCYGWSLHFKAGSFLDFYTEQVEILDNTSQTLVALRYTLYTKSVPPFASKLELAFMKPIE
jgi:hypothetical protein